MQARRRKPKKGNVQQIMRFSLPVWLSLSLSQPFSLEPCIQIRVFFSCILLGPHFQGMKMSVLHFLYLVGPYPLDVGDVCFIFPAPCLGHVPWVRKYLIYLSCIMRVHTFGTLAVFGLFSYSVMFDALVSFNSPQFEHIDAHRTHRHGTLSMCHNAPYAKLCQIFAMKSGHLCCCILTVKA